MLASCTVLFMLWLAKFEHANHAWELGSFGWFMSSKEIPISTWFSFETTPGDNYPFKEKYKKGYVNYFTVGNMVQIGYNDFEVQRGRCKLDDKVYLYQEWVKKE